MEEFIVIVIVGYFFGGGYLEIEEAEGMGEFVDEGCFEFFFTVLGEMLDIEFDIAIDFGIWGYYFVKDFVLGVEGYVCADVFADSFVVFSWGPGVVGCGGCVDFYVYSGVLFNDFAD